MWHDAGKGPERMKRGFMSLIFLLVVGSCFVVLLLIAPDRFDFLAAAELLVGFGLMYLATILRKRPFRKV
jgi:hypothetical protein